MILPADKWFDAIFVRRSRRQFVEKEVSDNLLNNLNNFVEELNNYWSGARVVIVNENPDKVFKGAIGSYGKIKGAPAYAAFIGNMEDPNVQEKVGYKGECFILEATSKGLATCWVGGFFNAQIVKEQINIGSKEKVLAVTPIGYPPEKYTFEEKIMSGFASGYKRKQIDTLCENKIPKDKPAWLINSLEAARVAPSAVNRQPWRFTIEDNGIKISVDAPRDTYHISKRLDCGIAMLHLEIGANCYGVKGNWRFLNEPDVAMFIIRDDCQLTRQH